MKNFKSLNSGKVYKYIGTFKNDEGETCYKTGEYHGIKESDIELTDDPEWLNISFNCRLRYNEAKNCVKYIESIGGDGNITSGGSWFTGDNKIICELIGYMSRMNYDLESMSFDNCNIATKKRIEQLKKEGII